MANNYTLFSQVIDGVTPEEETWLKEACTVPEPGEETSEVRKKLLEQYSHHVAYEDNFPMFDWHFGGKGEGRMFFIVSEEDGSIDDIAVVVQEFLAKFRPDNFFQLSWAATCSSPRVGEFGGGAVFVTAKGAKFMSDTEWLRLQREEFRP
jgi:hypothetical protein